MQIIEVNLQDIGLTEDKIQVNFSEVKIHEVEVNAIKIHTKANTKTTVIKVIITKIIKVYIITHAETSNSVIIMANLEAEAVVVAEVTVAMAMAGPIIKVMLTTNTISIMAMMMSTRQTNMVHHVHYMVVITTPLNIVLRENTISMILWKR